MTEQKMQEIINVLSPWESLTKNSGISEFYTDTNGMSLGISYEDIDDEKNIYIYNIFYGNEYINISHHGIYTNPLPDCVIIELTKMWNNLQYKRLC